MSHFDQTTGALTDALDGDFRRQVVEQIAAGADFRTSLTRLRDAMRAHVFKIGKKRVDFGPLVRALDQQTRADGFHVLHDWNGPAKKVNDDMIVVDVLHYVIEKGGHEQSDPATLAILLDYYFTYVTGLLALRAWDDGDANVNLDRVDALVDSIQGPGGSGQRFVDDAATLTVIVTAHYEPDDPAYDRLLAKIQSLDATHRARSGIVHAATMGNHLRFGMAATYGGSLSGMREDNTVDYPWLCFALASTMAEYARLVESRAPEDARAPYVEAILGGLSPDAQAFLTEPVAALAARQHDRTLLVDLFRAHREAFLADAVRHRPIDERFTPFGLMFNFSHNVLKGLVADSLLWGEAGALGFNDLLTALPHASAKNTGRTTLAKTLMGYARKNPEKVAGRLTPVIVYDAQAGRRAFAAAQQAIAGRNL